MTKTEEKFFNLQVELNDVCNLECRHCYQYRLPDKEELDIDLVLNQCAELKSYTGFREFLFRLSGGEATLRKDLFSIIRKIKAQGYQAQLLSNGVLIDLPYAFALKAAGTLFVQISLDGASAEKHDFIRGKGSFAKTLKGIKNLNKANLPVEIKFTLINQVNNEEIGKLFNLCQEIEVKYISFARFIYEGNGINQLKNGNFSGTELRDLFSQIIEKGKNYPEIQIRIRDPLAKNLEIVDVPQNIKVNQEGYIGVNYLALDTYGNVYADRQLNIVLANIKKESLKEIWESNLQLRELKGDIRKLKGKCISCSLNETCLGGNKTAAFALTGDPFAPDPSCWLS